jgi:hypothetical protein
MLKTFICGAAFTLLAATAFSQKGKEGSVYLKGGLNIANISTTSGGHIDHANDLASFHAGIMGDVPLGKVLALQPGLLFTGKGSKTQTGQPGDAYYWKATSNPCYIEIPLNLVVKVPLADKGSDFFVGAGPYAAIGIAGKNKSEGNAGPLGFNSSENIKFTDVDPSNQQESSGLGIMHRFDFGLNGTAGFELGNVLLSVNYGYGLTKVNSVPKNNTDDKNKHRVLGVSVGFKL